MEFIQNQFYRTRDGLKVMFMGEDPFEASIGGRYIFSSAVRLYRCYPNGDYSNKGEDEGDIVCPWPEEEYVPYDIDDISLFMTCKDKDSTKENFILEVDREIGRVYRIRVKDRWYAPVEMLKLFTHLDGKPFGKLKELK